MLVEVEIVGLTVDPSTQSPVIFLKDKNGPDTVPIWIGLVEASAIAMEMEEVAPPRPMTHDLIRNILSGTNTSLSRIAITELKENTYYGVLYLSTEGREYEVDSRPSDAIAVALRMKAPIFIDSSVIEQSRIKESAEDGSDGQALAFTPENKERWGELLEKLRPEDIGKYKM